MEELSIKCLRCLCLLVRRRRRHARDLREGLVGTVDVSRPDISGGDFSRAA